MGTVKNTLSSRKFKNHFDALLPLIFFTFIIGIGLYIYYSKYGIPDYSMKVFIISVYLLFAIPCFYLHLEYLFINWNTSLIIDYGSKQISYKKGKQNLIFAFNDIKALHFFGETKAFNNLPNQSYSFYILEIKNNIKICLTCLVVSNRDEIFSQVHKTRNRRLIASFIYEDIKL